MEAKWLVIIISDDGYDKGINEFYSALEKDEFLVILDGMYYRSITVYEIKKEVVIK